MNDRRVKGVKLRKNVLKDDGIVQSCIVETSQTVNDIFHMQQNTLIHNTLFHIAHWFMMAVNFINLKYKRHYFVYSALCKTRRLRTRLWT